MTTEKMDILPEDLPSGYRDIAETIGLQAALRLMELRGGETIYIPKIDCIGVAARNRSIRAEFNGRNHRELARRYGLTVTWVREILAGGGIDYRPQHVDKQLELF